MNRVQLFQLDSLEKSLDCGMIHHAGGLRETLGNCNGQHPVIRGDDDEVFEKHLEVRAVFTVRASGINSGDGQNDTLSAVDRFDRR